MAKDVHDDILDLALNGIKNNVTRVVICSQEPTTYAEANATYALADVTVDSNDFTVAAGATSGRKVTCGEQTNVTVDATGTAAWWAWLDVSNTKLIAKDQLTASQAVTQGNTATFPATSYTIPDPA